MSRNSRKVIAIILLVAFVAWIFFTVFPIGGPESRRPSADRPTATEYEPKFRKDGELFFVQPEAGDTIKQIDIEIADEPEEREYGMMYRKSMDPNTGMLFLMGEERQQSFWMKNTYVSLDILYLNDDLEVVSIQKNAEPLNTRSLPSEGPASHVLEVTGGFTDQFGIGKGTKIYYDTEQ